MTYRSRLLPISLALAFLAGCDSSADKDKKGAVAEKSMQDAQNLLEEARAAGTDKIAAEEFEAQSKKLEDAQKLIDEGKADKAVTRLKSASNVLKELIQRSADFKKQQATATDSKKKAEAAVAAAKKQGIDAAAPEAWEEVTRLLEKANADLQDPKRASGASSNFAEVLNRLKTAKQSADEAKLWKEKAEAQMKATKEREGEAVKERASPSDLTVARQFSLEAESDFKGGKFQEAFTGFQKAEVAFAEALSRAKEAKEVALSNQPMPEPANPAPSDPGAGVAKKVDPPPAPEEPATDVEKKAAPEEPGAVAGKVAEGELSPEDEDFLVKNVSKFCSKRPVEYDPGSGMITVEYPFGDEMKKDLLFPQGMIPSHIAYRDPTMQIGSKQAKGQKEVGVTFLGNTGGLFLFPFPFKETVTMEYNVQIGMMKSEGTLTAILMSSKDAKSYIGANFGTVEFWQNGRLARAAPPLDPKYKKSPNMWFSKTELGGVGMRIMLEPHKDGKRSQVKIFYNTAVSEDEPINIQALPSRSGFAGFAWSSTKFYITMFKITGKLDKPAAVKLLKEKLGAAQEEDAANPKAPKAPKKEAGSEESAGAPAGEEKSAKPKKTADAKKAPAEGDADY